MSAVPPVFAAEIDDGTGIAAEDMAAHQAIVEMVSTGAKDGFELVSEFTVQESDDIISATMIYVKEEITPCSSEWEQKTVEVEKVFTESRAEFINTSFPR